MKYRLLSDLLDLKRGEVVETNKTGAIIDPDRHVYLDVVQVDIYERLGVLEKVTEAGEVWVPYVGQSYWHADVGPLGGVNVWCKQWEGDKFDLLKLAEGNVYKTNAEAQAYADKKIAEGRLLVERSNK